MADSKINFTKGNIDALPIPEQGKRATYHDAKTPGLQLRVTPAGKQNLRGAAAGAGNGDAERVTLGSYPAMTPEQARKKAAEVNATIAKGAKPDGGEKARQAGGEDLGRGFHRLPGIS